VATVRRCRRSLTASGSIIAEAAEVLIGSGKAGMLAPSEAVDPQAFLAGLSGRGLVVEATIARERHIVSTGR
jgi:hypothetical protein